MFPSGLKGTSKPTHVSTPPSSATKSSESRSRYIGTYRNAIYGKPCQNVLIVIDMFVFVLAEGNMLLVSVGFGPIFYLVELTCLPATLRVPNDE